MRRSRRSTTGFEIAKKNEAYALHQEKYVGELLQRRQVQGRENHPLPKIVEDCEWKDPRIFKECQAVIGELQWLAMRTRPDLCYSTSLVARMIHRRPAYALGLCSHLLRYLAEHQTYGLRYGVIYYYGHLQDRPSSHCHQRKVNFLDILKLFSAEKLSVA